MSSKSRYESCDVTSWSRESVVVLTAPSAFSLNVHWRWLFLADVTAVESQGNVWSAGWQISPGGSTEDRVGSNESAQPFAVGRGELVGPPQWLSRLIVVSCCCRGCDCDVTAGLRRSVCTRRGCGNRSRSSTRHRKYSDSFSSRYGYSHTAATRVVSSYMHWQSVAC